MRLKSLDRFIQLVVPFHCASLGTLKQPGICVVDLRHGHRRHFHAISHRIISLVRNLVFFSDSLKSLFSGYALATFKRLHAFTNSFDCFKLVKEFFISGRINQDSFSFAVHRKYNRLPSGLELFQNRPALPFERSQRMDSICKIRLGNHDHHLLSMVKASLSMLIDCLKHGNESVLTKPCAVKAILPSGVGSILALPSHQRHK